MKKIKVILSIIIMMIIIYANVTVVKADDEPAWYTLYKQNGAEYFGKVEDEPVVTDENDVEQIGQHCMYLANQYSILGIRLTTENYNTDGSHFLSQNPDIDKELAQAYKECAHAFITSDVKDKIYNDRSKLENMVKTTTDNGQKTKINSYIDKIEKLIDDGWGNSVEGTLTNVQDTYDKLMEMYPDAYT